MKKNKNIKNIEQQCLFEKMSSTFIQKLRFIINNQPQYISWEQDQIHFTIFNVKAFESYILSKYFRHNRFTSFNRQLNMRNFHKKRTTSTNSLSRMSYLRNGQREMNILKEKIYVKKENDMSAFPKLRNKKVKKRINRLLNKISMVKIIVERTFI